MPARLTQEHVDAWLAENRPDFKPVDGWVYVTANTPIPGSCRACGADDIAPALNSMKNSGKGHCRACGERAVGEAHRARGEAEVRRVAADRGYEVAGFFTRGYKTVATLRCGCGNEWSTLQTNLCSRGSGCPSCAEFGYDDSKPGAIYLIARSVNGVEQRGYGISNDWPTRIKGYERFGWLPLDVMEFSDGETARNAENMLNRVVAATAGRSVEADNLKYRNKEAWSDGNGIPMFNSVWAFLCWAAPLDARELQDA
jgi:hypothetical protein